MSLHGLLSVTIGVPNVDQTAAYYADFGLEPSADGWFSTTHGGRQLRIERAPTRRLIELRVAADDADDLARIEASLGRMGISTARTENAVETVEPVTGARVRVEIASRPDPPPVHPVEYNGPGWIVRTDARAPLLTRPDPVRPRKLGHAVLGSTNAERTTAFFIDGLGFKVSDRIKGAGAFMRCSSDHHNVLVLGAPVNFLHHTSWQVDDVDEVGRGAHAMLAGNPERHVWGARTSSGTSRIRPATSPSTTRTWTASWTTSSGPRRTWKALAACSPGARHRRPRSSPPTTWPR
jgi:catechol 2,3-dioxygenase-like lactoylglutathione lyase family enzyme